MTSFARKSIKHLGTLHGEGTLLIEDGRQLGQVAYEIDGYLDGDTRLAHGQIEAARHVLDEASLAVDATLVLDSGRCVHVVLSDPQGSAAEVRLADAFPL